MLLRQRQHPTLSITDDDVCIFDAASQSIKPIKCAALQGDAYALQVSGLQLGHSWSLAQVNCCCSCCYCCCKDAMQSNSALLDNSSIHVTFFSCHRTSHLSQLTHLTCLWLVDLAMCTVRRCVLTLHPTSGQCWMLSPSLHFCTSAAAVTQGSRVGHARFLSYT